MSRYNDEMHWIYLSPHYDDAALSCGGLAWGQVRSGENVHIWTVCAGNPPEGELSAFAKQLHSQWGAGQDSTAQRRGEDTLSCHLLGAIPHYFTLPDSIYRRHPHTGEFLYDTKAALNGRLHPADAVNISLVSKEIARFIDAGAVLVCPLGLGNHVDHQLIRLAAETTGLVTWYYADFPYVLRCREKLVQLNLEGWQSQVFPVLWYGLCAWQDSIAAHASQISTFWKDQNEMRKAVENYLEQNGGIRLWRKPTRTMNTSVPDLS